MFPSEDAVKIPCVASHHRIDRKGLIKDTAEVDLGAGNAIGCGLRES
jgi:hypothetical protein